MIDVIIPAFNAHETIDKTLASIAFQDCVDKLNVYIVDDCSKKNYSDFVKFYSNFMNIVEIKTDVNGGPGKARQLGIDSSKSEFLIFIDSDDVFSDNFAISRLFNAIVETNSDIAVSGFYEEKKFGFIFYDVSYVWMHGKIYRREFFNKNKIYFNDSRANEDCGFNHLCYLCGASYVEVEGVSYIWRNNQQSITRLNNGETFRKNIKSFTYNMMWALSESRKRNFNKERFQDIAYGTFVSCYHYFLQDQESFIKNNVFEQICLLYDYIDLTKIDEERRTFIIKNQLMSEVSGPELYKVYNPSLTLNDFFEIIKNKREGYND